MRSTLSGSVRSYWMIPLVYVAATICLAFTVPRAEYTFLPGLNHEITVSSAIAMFSSIASGMIALTAIVFSLAFVMVQFTTSAYSPRLVLRFSKNPVLLHSMGIFSATFIYALAALGWVDRGASGRVPFISAWIVFLLLISSMLALVKLVHGLSELQITNVLQFIGHRGRQVIKEMYPPVGRWVPTEGLEEGLPIEIQGSPVTQTLYFSGEPLVITSIDIPSLVHLARQAEGVIVMRCAVGDAVMEDATILQILGGQRQLSESDLVKTVRLGPERTFDQDPKYAIRLLVDIAIKALSPGINDPTTAVQAVDQIEDLLRRLATSNLDNGWVQDEEGRLRLIFPTPRWDDYLSLAFDEISFYGAVSVQVMRKLRSTINELVEMAQPEKKEGILSYIEHLNKIIDHSFTEEQDRLKAKQEDRQGLGLTSRRNRDH